MNLENVNIIDLYGDGWLNHAGTGTAIVNQGTITQIVCGQFGNPQNLPVVGNSYAISGTMVGGGKRIDFKTTLSCTNANIPQCIFQ